MPFEFAAVQDMAPSSTPVHVHPATILSSDSVARVSRRESFAITPVQHDWIIDCLNTLSISPTHEPFLDHALLIQVIVNGTSTRPAAAKMDSNLKKLKQRVQGFQADCECRTNQVFRLQFLIMADTQWLKSSPIASRRRPASPPQSASPVTIRSASKSITPQGLPLRDTLSSRSHSRPSSNAQAPSSPARSRPSSGARAPSSPDRPSRPRGGPLSPVRTLPSSVRSLKSRGTPPSTRKSPSEAKSVTVLRSHVQQQPQATGKSPSEAKSVTVLRSRVQQQPRALPPSVATPWYLQPSVMVPFVTMHVLVGIGVIHLINAFVFSFGN